MSGAGREVYERLRAQGRDKEISLLRRYAKSNEYEQQQTEKASLGMITIDDVEAAASRIKGSIRRTPVIEATQPLDPPVRNRLWLKLESLQVTGSFKARGATNPIACNIGRGSPLPVQPGVGVVERMRCKPIASRLVGARQVTRAARSQAAPLATSRAAAVSRLGVFLFDTGALDEERREPDHRPSCCRHRPP